VSGAPPRGDCTSIYQIRKFKTDVFSKGVEVCIAYSSESGVEVLPWVQVYLDYLKLGGLAADASLFQSFTGKSEQPVTTSKWGKDALSI